MPPQALDATLHLGVTHPGSPAKVPTSGAADVLNVLGMYPGIDPGPPGSDCAGTITHTAASGRVHGLCVGDEVVGLAHGCLGTAIVAPAATLVKLPQATGGVGLAAVQLLQALGAEVVATAGSPAKRSLLRSLGVAKVISSRGIEFTSELAGTGSFDVVLNSLTSPGLVAATLAGLRAGGRFVEIGKRGIWSPSAIHAMRPDVQYSLLAVDFVPPSIMGRMLSGIASSLARGTAKPLQALSYGLGSVAGAMRAMMQAQHTGKIVVRQKSMGRSRTAAITGGLGGLGLLSGKWLLGRAGATRVTLLGRSGRVAEATSQAAFVAMASSAGCLSAQMLDASRLECTDALLGSLAQDAGMASQAVLARLDRIGQGFITPQQGLAVLGASLAAPTPNPVVAANPFSWARFLQHLPGSKLAGLPAHLQEFASHLEPVLSSEGKRMLSTESRPGTTSAGGTSGLRTKQELVQLVTAAVRDVAGDVGPDEPLMSAGLDSLGSVELAPCLPRALFSASQSGAWLITLGCKALL
ncbi:hypothetical protein WJX84_003790 [Apatococcus fuscideae]|uniref:Enoyl reductase (ER) domain-containing protein n=1 Tax=Apatococcus fuscideae TaxID=2026836 RepID=A0AAW1SPI0_9CHLO